MLGLHGEVPSDALDVGVHVVVCTFEKANAIASKLLLLGSGPGPTSECGAGGVRGACGAYEELQRVPIIIIDEARLGEAGRG